MSHEIRASLEGILGGTRALAENLSDPRSRETLAKIDEAANNLRNVLEDWARIEIGEVRLDAVEFSLQELFDQVHSQVYDRIQAKGLVFRSDTGGLPRVIGDPARLRQALLNDLDAAIESTDLGSIRLRAGVVEEADDRLFVRFDTTAPGGAASSLGLAIARRIAELMGGTAGVQRQPGGGATFWFTAWLRRQPDSFAMSAATRRPRTAEVELRRLHTGARVLLAEDNELNREVACTLLEKVGLVVECAGDGREAVAMAQRRFYDLVLMDVQMPEMDGLDATRAIRALPGWAAIPIVAVTAHAFIEDRERCLEAGMNDHLAKPVDPTGFYECLLRWLRRRHGRA